uniref:Mannan-binding lectin serine protease 2-like isoform X1 n=1 Tax=Petromyzon marinus TaxID=7757 RepID=A0AAJ7X1X7_PETMA|nr:mannan-binding lectin serine protease 2-like isoform X1 [Petromyzon marinus]
MAPRARMFSTRWLLLLLLPAALCGLVAEKQHRLSGMSGSFTSPGYPTPYKNQVLHTWQLSVPAGYRLRLQFQHFEVEPSYLCEYDYLKVMAGEQQLGLFCGQHSTDTEKVPGKEPILAPSNTMTVTFRSDYSNEEHYTGFAGHFTAVDIDECVEYAEHEELACNHFCHNYPGGYLCSCRHSFTLDPDGRTCTVECSGLVFTERQGELSSPEYPKPYPWASQCSYTVRLEEGFVLNLAFQETFDLELHPHMDNCPYDSLTIRSGGQQWGPLCGKTLPDPIETKSPVAEIIFISDKSGDNIGWKIHYTSKGTPCPMVVEPAHGFIEPVQDSYSFKDQVVFFCNTGYRLIQEEDNEVVPSLQMACQSDGTWSRMAPSCRIVDCGPPLALDNGRGTEADSTTFQASVDYACDEPYYNLRSKRATKFVCNETGVWMNPETGEKKPYCEPVCGRPSRHLPPLRKRIVGGLAAEPGAFPWQALVVARDPARVNSEPWFGGAALLAPRWLLTAAHVLLPWRRTRSSSLSAAFSSSAATAAAGASPFLLPAPRWAVEAVPPDSLRVYLGFTDVRVRDGPEPAGDARRGGGDEYDDPYGGGVGGGDGGGGGGDGGGGGGGGGDGGGGGGGDDGGGRSGGTDKHAGSALRPEVARIILHPRFDPKTYDNDVALIELREAVHLGPLVMPVCLPPAAAATEKERPRVTDSPRHPQHLPLGREGERDERMRSRAGFVLEGAGDTEPLERGDSFGPASDGDDDGAPLLDGAPSRGGPSVPSGTPRPQRVHVFLPHAQTPQQAVDHLVPGPTLAEAPAGEASARRDAEETGGEGNSDGKGGGDLDDALRPGDLGVVSGWGSTAWQNMSSPLSSSSSSSMVSPTLQYVKLPVVEAEECEEGFRQALGPRPSYRLTDNMFCAGYKEGGRDTCVGDSGGAFVRLESGDTAVGSGVEGGSAAEGRSTLGEGRSGGESEGEGRRVESSAGDLGFGAGDGMEGGSRRGQVGPGQRWVVRGLVSWGGPGECGREGLYGVYTRLANYVSWIREQMEAPPPDVDEFEF